MILGAAFVVAVDGVVGSRASASLRHHQRYRARRCCWRRCLFGGENSRLVRREVGLGGRPGCQGGHGFLRCCCFVLRCVGFVGAFKDNGQWCCVLFQTESGAGSGKREEYIGYVVVVCSMYLKVSKLRLELESIFSL